MLTPTTKRIFQLPPVANDPAQVVDDAVWEAEFRIGPNGDYKNVKLSYAQMVSLFGSQPPNLRKGGRFCVIYLTHADAVAGGRPTDSSLDQIPGNLLHLGAQARVDLHPDGAGVELVLGYDPRPAGSAGQLLVYKDGFLTGAQEVPVRWQKTGLTPGPVISDLSGNPTLLALRDKAGSTTGEKENVQVPVGLLAPARHLWIDPATTTQASIVLVRGDSYYEAGREYKRIGPTTENPVPGGYRTLAAAEAADPDEWELLAGGPTAPQWVAGPQAATSLVYHQGHVYRVQQALADSQVAPPDDNQHYLLIGPGAGGSATLRDIYDVPQAVRDAVSGGQFTGGELQGSQPGGSAAGLKFTTTTYGYEYQRGASGALVWCRYPKG